MAAVIIEDLCVGCGQCASVCSRQAISMTVKKASVNAGLCDECEECVFVCINGAIVMA